MSSALRQLTEECSRPRRAWGAREQTSLRPEHSPSIRTCDDQPSFSSSCRNATDRLRAVGLFSAYLISTQMRRIRSGFCARALSGDVRVALPSPDIK